MISKYRTAAMVLAVILAVVIAYFEGREAGLERYHDYKAKVEAEQRVIADREREREQKQQQVLKNTVDAWAEVVSGLHGRSAPVVRVLPANCPPGGAQAIPSPPGGVPQLQVAESGPGPAGDSEKSVTALECERRLNWAIEDAVWIEAVKKLTDDLHWTSK